MHFCWGSTPPPVAAFVPLHLAEVWKQCLPKLSAQQQTEMKMGHQDLFIAVTDALVVMGTLALLAAAYGSWLASYLTPKLAPVGANLWFLLPPWAQVLAGFAVSVVCGYAFFQLWTPLPFSVSPGIALLLRIVGLVFVIGGIALWFWARWNLGRMMGISTSSAAQLTVDHRLVQNGAYAIVRHPMYLSYWLLLAGLFLTYRTWMPLVLLALLGVALFMRARREELVLQAAFGEEWRLYLERVPMLIPHRK